MPDEAKDLNGSGAESEESDGIEELQGDGSSSGGSDNSSNSDIQEDSFGYSLEGTWDEVVGFAKSITASFEEHDVENETIDDWESWRPRNEEEREQMREKTVEKAKVKEGENPGEMAGTAAEHFSESQKHTSKGDIDRAAEEATESAKSAGKAVEGASRGVMRKFEDWVYKRITKTNPLYFDTKDFNASLEKLSSFSEKINKIKNGDDKEQEYRLSIKPQSQNVEDALDESFVTDDEPSEDDSHSDRTEDVEDQEK